MTQPAVDPAVAIVLHVSLALLWAWSAAHKGRDLGTFAATLDAYELLPSRLVKPFARLITGTEVVLALTLLWPSSARAAALATAVMLVIYATAIAINLRRGRRDIDCGCGGPAHRQRLHDGLVVRNLILIGLALLASIPNSPRHLSWVDAVSIAAAVITAALLYLAIDRLMAQTPWWRLHDRHDGEVAHA